MIDIADASNNHLLPDSRLVRPVGSQRVAGMGYWQQVFCAVCHRGGAFVPEDNMDFICWVCNDCAPKFGEEFGALLMPDEVFWERLKQESFAHFGYYPTAEELDAVRTANCSPLATLLIEGAKPRS